MYIRRQNMNVPNHVALILDGNGRWAKAQGKPRTFGHKVGAENVEVICRAANDLGIKYLTMYAFSTENWNRPKSEVTLIMQIILQYLKRCEKIAEEENMPVTVIGDRTALSKDLIDQIERLEESSKNNTRMHLILAINYGSRDEMLRAMRSIVRDAADGKIEPEKLDEAVFSSYLDTKGIPDPDLLIRTSGEQRLSNYLLWQLAYSEFYFTEVPWPAFTPDELRKAVEEYDHRHRRFGALETEEE